MLQQRSERLSAAIIEMVTTNWQRGPIENHYVKRKVANCDLTYSADARMDEDSMIGFDGCPEDQRFDVFTEKPLTHDEAKRIEQSVYTATSHNIVLDEDSEGCWEMHLGQGLN